MSPADTYPVMSLFIQAVETVKDPQVNSALSVAAIVALGKVWDKVVGRNRDKAARLREEAVAKRLDEHAAADVASFNRIDRALAVVEIGIGTLQRDVGTINERMYSERPNDHRR